MVNSDNKCEFEDALDLSGFGRYNIAMLATSCLLILAMYLDIFGFSVILPAVSCDMELTSSQQGLLSAVPLIGIMISSYVWGLSADTIGRRKTLLIAMPIGTILNLVGSIAPNYLSLAVLKFLSGAFTSSANACVFVLVGECTPRRHRSRFMFLMASATFLVQFIICLVALPVFQMNFRVVISWMSLEYRPWRLLLQIISLPGIIGIIGMLCLAESPKFLLSIRNEDSACDTLKVMFKWNNRGKDYFKITSVYLEESASPDTSNSTFLHKMWGQTAPLFNPPLLANSLKLYYILLCAYMTSTGYTMWVPTMTNAFFNGDDASGQTFCEVASKAVVTSDTPTDCDQVIQPLTLYAVMCYSGASGTLNILLSFLVGPMGKKGTTLLVMSIAAGAGLALLFVRIPLLSIALFYIFLYVALILGNVNTYLVELNPTYLRGMATCLSVVVARGFAFLSVQLIASLLTNHCTAMISGYVVLITSGLVVALFLPPDFEQIKMSSMGAKQDHEKQKYKQNRGEYDP